MIALTNQSTQPVASRMALVYILEQPNPNLIAGDATLQQYFIKETAGADNKLIWYFRPDQSLAVFIVPRTGDEGTHLEKCRRAGDTIQLKAKEHQIDMVQLVSEEHLASATLAFAEGMMLGAYEFAPYKAKKPNDPHPLQQIVIKNPAIAHSMLQSLSDVVKAVYFCRDLVNTPANFLNTLKLAERITTETSRSPITTEVLNQKQIESLKMGGLLGVNKGSVDPPVFIIMEYKPQHAVNAQPLVFVGKGVTFDTGGMNLKTGTFMDNMKLDMGGAAAVASALKAIAECGLPVHTVVLIPATDNRTHGNPMVPGDVITMFDGTTVEVLNTDAEGRLILADALAWAKRYNPMLVVDAATLTGAAARAIGSHGIVAMHQHADQYMQLLKTAGEATGERIAEFPFWEEYDEQVKSEIADLKNIGGPEAGAITAGKFLAHFTDYPYIHLDIAGPVFIEKRDSYRGLGATGVAVRLLIRFAEQIAEMSRK